MAYYILKSYKLKVKPLEIFAALKNEGRCFFLDSSLNSNSLGRYSFLGIDPFYVLEAKNQDPLPRLREILSRYRISLPKNSLPFFGGAVGYLAYDLGFTLEKKLKKRPKAGLAIADCALGFYNTAIIIDHFKQLFYIFSVGFPERNYYLAKSLCEFNFKKIYKLLCKIPNIKKPILSADIRKSSATRISGSASATRIGGCANICGAKIFGGNADKRGFYQDKNLRPSVCNLRESALKEMRVNSNFTREEYILAVKKAKEYIRKGDIYQVNLSQEFHAKTDLPGFAIYKRLRQISPSYFSAYLDCQNFQILSSSPESFLRLEGNAVSSRPMKGTRPRSKNKPDDRRFKQELLESAKDKAELIMIVDLERNDLGRVCNYDSIGVSQLRQLEEYSTVFQTTATVCGRLHKNKDRIDLLRACFPGGSITGCPKIRAMEIIEELEPNRRNVYTGCLGYLSFSGTMDLNILIRTILKKEDELYFSVGGGIVADSKPEDEYQETLVKAKAMTKAINPVRNLF